MKVEGAPQGRADAAVDYNKRETAAIQCLAKGEATPEQQKIALDWIIEKACNRYDVPYRPSERDTSFLCGRMFVGQQIIKQIKLKLGPLTEEASNDG